MERKIRPPLSCLLLQTATCDSGDPDLVAAVDGKPLPVGGDGKDPDARFGRGTG